MNLSNLQPAEGSTHNQNKRVEEKVLERVLLQEVKGQNLVLVILKIGFEGNATSKTCS
jgi:hypothetical protein